MSTSKKISKVIFVTEEVNQVIMSNTIVLEKPKMVGNVEIKDAVAKIKTIPSQKALFWKNFPISEWSKILSIAVSANKIIGSTAITLSKKAYVDDRLDSEFFSVWYTCGSKDFREYFKKEIAITNESEGLRKLIKSEIKKLTSDFFILFIDDYCETDFIECTVNEHSIKKIGYSVIGVNQDFSLDYSLISESGKGRIVESEEDFYFFVDEKLENL